MHFFVISASAVDILYAAFPAYLYLNPAIGGHLLKPLLVAQDTPLYSQPYAAKDLGQCLHCLKICTDFV